MLTSREAAEIACGADAVHNYGRVKTFYTRFGHALEVTFARAVGGRLGGPGEPDVITSLGAWAFATQGNTKNSAGSSADLASVEEGFAVQVIGTPKPGWVSGLEFLARHGIPDPRAVAAECEARALVLSTDGGEQITIETSSERPCPTCGKPLGASKLPT